MDKFELASPQWLAALREYLTVYSAKASPDFALSICEIFTAVPKHLDRHGDGVIAWHGFIKDGRVDFHEGAIPEADFRVEVDYRFGLTIARWVYTPDVMGEVEAYRAKGVAEGKMKATGGNPSKVPPTFVEIHNSLAARTL